MSLTLRGLTKRFGTNPVVKGLDLEVKAGEIVALLGPSGCGKTTALRLVAGLESPDAGTIQIGERIVRDDRVDLPPEDRQLGMVFQSYAVWPHRTVRENVAYPLQLRKDPAAMEKADRALALVRLDGLGDRHPNALSGGQQQRVAVARALVAHPALLLCDEPLSNLDQKLREEMRHEIRTLVKTVGSTALYVTHDQPEAFAVSDRVAVMLKGVLAQLGAPIELYNTPVSLDVAKFVGRLSLLSVSDAGPEKITVDGATVPVSYAPNWQESPTLGVRPEDVAIGKGLKGRVTRSSFLGERSEVWVETSRGVVKMDLVGTAPLEGETIEIEIRRGRVYGTQKSDAELGALGGFERH